MEATKPCDTCKAAEADGVLDNISGYHTDYVASSDPEDSDPDDGKDLDIKNNLDYSNAAKITKYLWGSSSEDSGAEDASDKSKKRVKCGYVKMPTEYNYNIPVPQLIGSNWNCTQHKTIIIPITPENKSTEYEYRVITKEMEDSIVQIRGLQFERYNVIKIEKIVNVCRWKEYLHRQKMIKDEIGYVNQRMLFHGTPFADEVAQDWFNEPFFSKRSVFGAGIYFAEQSAKANLFVFGPGRVKGCPTHKERNCLICVRKMLLCRVTLGKSKTEWKHVDYPPLPEGYHSVRGISGRINRVISYPEYVVYKREQVYPEYIITYKIEL